MIENKKKSTIDSAEIEKFSRMAKEWWDPQGKFRPLHKFNPTRLTYIKQQICEHFQLDILAEKPLKNLRILDIGCGGGLLCEPMARLGAEIVGVDAAALNIEIAKHHAQKSNLQIDYRIDTAEALYEQGEKFDVILSMEVVEHVADVPLFLKSCCGLAKDDGLILIGTINRTLKSWLLAIVGAEYILRWLPRGTHDYNKLIRPEELQNELIKHHWEMSGQTGIMYNFLQDEWKLSTDIDVNYIISAHKDKSKIL